MDKIYVVVRKDTCWLWEEPSVRMVYASRYEPICKLFVEQMEKEEDPNSDVHSWYYIDEIPVLDSIGDFDEWYEENNAQ